MNFYKEAGKRILKVRNMRNMTRDELAEKAGISPKFLYEIETGRKGFSASTLYDICTALGIRSDYLLTGDEQSNEDLELMKAIQLFDKSKSKHLTAVLIDIYKIIN